MGDLSEFVPVQSATVKAIYDFYRKRGESEPRRTYLGASVLGHECDRWLWYTFRGVAEESPEGRIYRLFETGDLEEPRLVADLRAIGCTVHEVDEQGQQFSMTALGGHVGGHADGVALGIPEAPKTWHLIELKTHNDKSFKKLVKEGVRASKPMHWAQMQTYCNGLGLTRALYLAKNKDTDELYAERVHADPKVFAALIERAARIIRTSQAPQQCAQRADDFRCKFCAGHALCWGSEDLPAVPIPRVDCRSCCHSTALTEGSGAKWRCEKFDTTLEDVAVGAECPAHLVLPGLVNFADPTDSDDDWIEFTSRDGTKWEHGPGEEQWSTKDLVASRGPLAGARKLPLLAVDFDDLPLLSRYPWEDSEKLWDGPAADLNKAMRNLGVDPDQLSKMPPRDAQNDEQVNAVEFVIGDEDLLIVHYKADDHAAVWRGKA